MASCFDYKAGHGDSTAVFPVLSGSRLVLEA